MAALEQAFKRSVEALGRGGASEGSLLVATADLGGAATSAWVVLANALSAALLATSEFDDALEEAVSSQPPELRALERACDALVLPVSCAAGLAGRAAAQAHARMTGAAGGAAPLPDQATAARACGSAPDAGGSSPAVSAELAQRLRQGWQQDFRAAWAGLLGAVGELAGRSPRAAEGAGGRRRAARHGARGERRGQRPGAGRAAAGCRLRRRAGIAGASDRARLAPHQEGGDCTI